MSADVFISYSSKDQRIATTICAALEERGFSCWIACRDVGPGENFQEAIVRAIRSAKVMILVFTANANNSDQIKKELVLADQGKVAVIPVRVEDVMPNEALTYEFATRQWIDLFENWELAIKRLSARIVEIAGRATTLSPPPAPRGPLQRIAQMFKDARRAVPAVDFSIGISAVAASAALVMAFSGHGRAALVILAGMVIAAMLVTLFSRLLSGADFRVRRIGMISIWGVSLLFVVFLTLMATTVAFRWPAVGTAVLGYEDGSTCSRPTERFEAFSCGPGDGDYVVVNIRLDDNDGGLVVREAAGVEAIQRGVIPPNGTGAVVEGCEGEWCRIRCRSLNLRGFSRKRYLSPQKEALYGVIGAAADSPLGLSMRTGPHQSCRSIGVLPYRSRDVVLHFCQSSPLERSATWCRITYQRLSGWIVYGFLERQQ